MPTSGKKGDRQGMATTLDFKNPTVVAVGHWNAAILNEPGWIARHILEVPSGEKIDLQAIVVGNEVSPGQVAAEKQIWLFEKFGMSCSGQRLELFARDVDDLQSLYDAIASISVKLPHTPMKAIGVNFFFQVTGDLAAITPMLETNDVFDGYGVIRSQDRTDSIEIRNEDLLEVEENGKPIALLNLTRKTDFNTAEINFNYHLPVPGMDFLSKWSAADPVAHWKQHAQKVISDCYGQDEIDMAYF